jgi:hypothetical protein
MKAVNCKTCKHELIDDIEAPCLTCHYAWDRQNQIHWVEKKSSALDVQVDGNHYKDKGIQPVVYIHANNLGFCEGNVVKYVTRWKDKNGIKDLEKAKHYIELLIELQSK